MTAALNFADGLERAGLVTPARRRSRHEAVGWLSAVLRCLPRSHPGMARLAAWAGLRGCGCPWTVAVAACGVGRGHGAARGQG